MGNRMIDEKWKERRAESLEDASVFCSTHMHVYVELSENTRHFLPT